MARPHKESKRLSVLLELTLSERLDRVSTESGISKTALVEQALKRYLDEKEILLKQLKK